MNISKHAEERYAERIMSYDEKIDRSIFITQHKEKIEKDLNKMREFGELIYSGKSLKESNSNIDIYLKDTWVLIVDKDKDLLVTVYKIDLQVGEDFTKEYISKVLDKLSEAKKEYQNSVKDMDKQTQTYRELIAANDLEITNYRKMAKTLEEQNEAYKSLISQSINTKKILDEKVRETVKILTGGKNW